MEVALDVGWTGGGGRPGLAAGGLSRMPALQSGAPWSCDRLDLGAVPPTCSAG